MLEVLQGDHRRQGLSSGICRLLGHEDQKNTIVAWTYQVIYIDIDIDEY